MQINLEHINTENLALGTKPIETEVQVLLIITFFDANEPNATNANHNSKGSSNNIKTQSEKGSSNIHFK